MTTDPRPPRWTRRKEARPEEILDAAFQVFAQKGFAAAKMDDIATLAGITKGTLYLYYPSKSDLLKAVVLHSGTPEISYFEESLKAATGPTAPLLEAFMVQAARMSTTRSSLLPKVIIGECGNFPELAQFWADTMATRGQALIMALLERGAARGEWPSPTVETGFALFAPLLQLSVWNNSIGAATGRTIEPDAYIAEVVRILIGGLSAPRKETSCTEAVPSS